jgi:LysR family glycine cleavage system transcriptional activator
MASDYPAPPDLLRAPLLHQDDTSFLHPPIDWAAWFRAAGLAHRATAGARFSQADHALDAAVAGAGVVLGRISLAERDIREGRLVMPYPLALTTEAVTRVVHPAGAETRPQVRTFLDWLDGEIASLEAMSDGMTFVAAADVAT